MVHGVERSSGGTAAKMGKRRGDGGKKAGKHGNDELISMLKTLFTVVEDAPAGLGDDAYMLVERDGEALAWKEAVEVWQTRRENAVKDGPTRQ
jgi:hypothetical protein